MQDSHIIQALQQNAPSTGRLLLALSGGMDSVLLLHLLVEAGLGERLCVVHVNHQLNVQSEQWAALCEQQCAVLAVPCTVCSVDVDTREGVECGAREARYSALFEAARAQSAVVITAHHQNDQAETLLLRLLRGAGVTGMAAMQPLSQRNGIRLWRPLLHCSRAQLARWAQARALTWVDDPSNEDQTLRRNYVRHTVLPAMAEHWPSHVKTLARAADNMAEAAGLLSELAEQDAQACGVTPGSFPLQATAVLSDARQRNVLRWWLDVAGATMPSAAVLAQLQALQHAEDDSQGQVAWGAWAVRLYRGALYLAPREAFSPWQETAVWHEGEAPPAMPGWQWSRHEQAGAVAVLRPQGTLVLRPLRGSARIRRHGMRQRVKELWRDAGVPPWLRHQWPLLYRDDQLISVPKVGVADEAKDETLERWFLLPQNRIAD